MDFRHVLVLVVLLQLSAPIFSACIGYNDSFDVRVLDGNLRPVPGASVWIKYDRGATFGDQYFTTPVNKTGPDGTFHYVIANQGTTTRTIDCKITINGSMGGQSVKLVTEANKHGPVVDVILSDVYPLDFYVRDQLKAPLPNASVTVANLSNKTDKDGRVRYYFKKGVYNYFASYLDASQPGKVNVSNDTTFEVVFPYYKISIDVTDDTGSPLPASLTIFNSTFEMANGHFEHDRTFGEVVPFVVDYKGIKTEDQILPASDPIVKITYDIHSPLFGNITPGILNNRPKLDITVSDPNQFASGIDVSSLKVSYKVEPSDVSTPWSAAVVYTTGRNKFTADFPELSPNTIVTFMIEVKDKAGNRADIDGKFSTFAESNPQNNTQNQTNTQPENPPEQGIPLLYIIGGVIILILAVYLVFRIKSKASGG
jgi:hypothetical protein